MKLTLLLQPTSFNEHQSNHVSVEVCVSENATVCDLLGALPPTIGQCPISPASVGLWYSGQRLQGENTLESYGVTSQKTSESPVMIYITIDEDSECPKKGKTKKSRSSKSKSKKCTFAGCTSMPLRMVGDCQLCTGKFCSKHRLLEAHQCKGLKGWKDTCFERNALKLQSEQTVAPKV